MDNYQSVPYIKKEVKIEIKWEQPEIGEFETTDTEIDSKLNVKFENYKQEYDVDTSGVFIQTEHIKIKSEKTEDGSQVDELNEVKEIPNAQNNISTPNTLQDAWKCYICRLCHNSKDELKAHITLTHRDPSNSNFFKCEICDYRTEYLNRLADHKSRHKIRKKKQRKAAAPTGEEVASELGTQKCAVCDVTYPTKSQLGEHTASSHKDPRDSNKFKCSFCDYVTEYFHRLIGHKSYHECPAGTKWFYCYKCSYRSRQKSILRQHIVKHGGI